MSFVNFFRCCTEDGINVRNEPDNCKRDVAHLRNIMEKNEKILSTKMTEEKYDINENDQDNNTMDIINKKAKKRGIKSLTGLFDGAYTLKEKINSENLSSDSTECLNTINAIDIPKILLVGTQTSGKSSLLNNIIGNDILPVGDNMVTRTPLYVSLRNGMDEKISLFIIENGSKNLYYEKKLDPDYSNFSSVELKKNIIELTNQITMGEFLISSTPIFLEIVKKDLIDLTIIDLPGIVTLACTDKGQPPTIVEDIQNLIESYMSSDNVFVVVVINAGNELETDNGLSLVKKFSHKYKKMRTMGVLTKIDLMDKKKIKNFDGIFSLSKTSDVALDYGYYAVNNSNDSNKWYQSYFSLKSQLILQKRYGVENILENLVRNTNLFLVNRVQQLKRDLVNIKTLLKKSIPIIGSEGDNVKSKLIYVINNCYIISREMSDSINSIGNNLNIGAKMRSLLDDYDKEINMYEPFDKANFSDSKLKDVINSFEGISNSSSNINLIIRKCFIDKEAEPFKVIKNIFLKCIEKLFVLLNTTFSYFTSLDDFGNTQSIIDQTSIKNYPKIVEFLNKNNMTVLELFKNKAIKIIEDYISMQMNLKIWYDENDALEIEDETNNIVDIRQDANTDDSVATMKAFKKRKTTTALRLFEEPQYNTNQIRCLINVIFRKSRNAAKDLSLKTIYSTFIIGYNYNLFHYLMSELNNMTDMDELFFTSSDKRKEVKKIENYIKDINEFVEFIDKYEG